MGIADAIGGVLLNAIDCALTIDVGCHPVDDEVADQVGPVMQLIVAVEIGNLVVDLSCRFLV